MLHYGKHVHFTECILRESENIVAISYSLLITEKHQFSLPNASLISTEHSHLTFDHFYI